MKLLVVFSVALACAAAAVDESAAPIVKSDYEISPEGAFQFAYETGNGISAQAAGVVKAVPGENDAVEVKGGYRYTSPDGSPVELTYLANEFGFQPAGSHLPVAPPVPEPILRSLAYIAAHPPTNNPGQYAQPAPQFQPPSPARFG